MKCSWNKTWQNKGPSNTYLWKQKIWKQKAVHDMASTQQGSWDWNRSLQHPGVPLLGTVVLSKGRVLLYLESYNEIKCNKVFLLSIKVLMIKMHRILFNIISNLQNLQHKTVREMGWKKIIWLVFCYHWEINTTVIQRKNVKLRFFGHSIIIALQLNVQ